LVTIDKFSKWVEVHPITNLRAEQVVTFFIDIVYRFGVPNSIITDNGSQFTGRKFLEFCDKFHIRVDWAAVAHPQTNGQVEHANGMILQGLKPRIFDRLNKSGRKWLQELPVVVWSLRTTPSRATGFTLFFLVHGAEAILPTDLEYGSPRVRGYDEDANQRVREDSLDQLDEARTVALMHSARYQQPLRRYQARKVRRRDFSEGDLVLRLCQDSRGRHKLSPLWEGPYVVVKVLKPGTYKLANEDVKNSPTLGTSSNYVASTLSEDFQVFCCKLHAQHPSWQSRCKKPTSQEKFKGNSAFPRKPSHPRGLLRGAPPPPKMVPFFRKKFANALSTIRP
jgi:transposase InsO family protein